MTTVHKHAAAALRQARYLQALGIDSYVARQPLPGAASSVRLAVAAGGAATITTPQATEPARSMPPAIPRLDAKPSRQKPAPPVADRAPTPASVASPAVKFSLGVMICGDVAWVEALDAYPLAREQVQLVHAMARAIGAVPGSPRVAQFDWPMHNNPQLDQGEAVARASLAAYLQRHLGEARCRALVCLGQSAAALTPVDALEGVDHIVTRSTREMLDEPACKRQVWADLQALVLA